MSILDELELRTQFEARRALSTSSAGASSLGAWARTRLPLAAPSRARAECVRGALVAALGTGDAETVAVLGPVWVERPRVDAAPLLTACEQSPHLTLAREVAARVVEAEPTTAALLTSAAIEERALRTNEAEALRRRAVAHAEGLADAVGAARARVELARGLVLVAREVEALEVVAVLESDPGAVPDARDQLILARVELAASGRYRRVRALDRLLDVVAGGGVAATAALRLLGRHVEAADAALTAAEIDRARAVLARARQSGMSSTALELIEQRLALLAAPEAEREAHTIRTLSASEEGRALVERARAVRDGGTAGPTPSARLRTPWLAMSVIAHVRTRRLGDALSALRALDASGAGPSVTGWTMLGRVAGERALRDPIVRLTMRWLEQERAPAPRRGYLDLALRLERAGLPELAALALGRARRVHEAGARELAIQHAIRRAWALRARGQTREAHRLLALALSDARSGVGSPRMSPPAPRTP